MEDYVIYIMTKIITSTIKFKSNPLRICPNYKCFIYKCSNYRCHTECTESKCNQSLQKVNLKKNKYEC
jgi:hypothetical protein